MDCRKKYHVQRAVTNPQKVRAIAWINSMTRRSRQKGIRFDKAYFTQDRLIDMQNSCPACPCCKARFSFQLDKPRGNIVHNYMSPSLDRIDSTKGYTKENVIIICLRCNLIKGSYGAEDHQMVADFLKKKLL